MSNEKINNFCNKTWSIIMYITKGSIQDLKEAIRAELRIIGNEATILYIIYDLEKYSLKIKLKYKKGK